MSLDFIVVFMSFRKKVVFICRIKKLCVYMSFIIKRHIYTSVIFWCREVLNSLCQALFVWKDKTKYYKRWYRGKPELSQTMVDSWYCLDWVVLEKMSHVWRWLEVGNHKLRTLNTRLSSDTSTGNFCSVHSPYINYQVKARGSGPPWRVDLNPLQKKFTRS